MSYTAEQPNPIVDHIPAIQSGTISDSNAVNITFSNVTERVTIVNATSSGTTSLQVALSEAGIPAERAVDDAFLARSGVAAVLAWLRLVTGGAPFAADDIEAAARRPSRGISPRVVGWMGEQRDLATEQAEIAASLGIDLDRWIDAQQAEWGSAGTRTGARGLDPETAEALRALGYME